MPSDPNCPRCNKNDKLRLLNDNKVTKVKKWYCMRCRDTFSRGGLKG